jgi:hypothetical protein
VPHRWCCSSYFQAKAAGSIATNALRVEHLAQLFFHDPDHNMIEICNCDCIPIVLLHPTAQRVAASFTQSAAIPGDGAGAWSRSKVQELRASMDMTPVDSMNSDMASSSAFSSAFLACEGHK